MPIKIPDQLPAAEVLTNENIFVMTNSRAMHQDIRPLKVLLLNLMPKKIETEIQLMRMLSNTPLQVLVDLLRIDDRESKNTPKIHVETFYQDFEHVKNNKYDGLIITGAPLGLIPLEDVVYWDTLEKIIRWSQTHVTSSLFLCWAAQAALKVLYGLEKQTRTQKLSGVYYHHKLEQQDPLVRGFDDVFLAPHSRNAQFDGAFIRQHTDLRIFAESEEAGVYLAASKNCKQVFVTGHPEYDADTLSNEYQRDLAAGIHPHIPANYFPNNDPSLPPYHSWRSHGHLLFSNWLNYYVYQLTPFDLETMNTAATIPDQDWEI